jgi:hypothetical protein
MGFFDICKIPVICHVLELYKENKINVANKSYIQFAFELLEVHYKQLVHFKEENILTKELYGVSKIFGPLFTSPSKYIVPRQKALGDMLLALKSIGKYVILLIESHNDFMNWLMK